MKKGRNFFYTQLGKMVHYIQPHHRSVHRDLLLEKILQHAFDHVPYYRRLFNKYHIVREGKIDLARFSQIPFLDKNILHAENKNLIAKNIDPKKTFGNTSGGSTGEPAHFLQDQDYLLETRRLTYEKDSWSGYRLGDSLVYLWGNPREILIGTNSWQSKLVNLIKNQVFLNAFILSPESKLRYLKIINREKPRLIISYVQSIYELARFAEREKIKIEQGIGAIISSAGVLYPFMRKKIEQVFQAPVFNRYGSREVGIIAAECRFHQGMHIASEGTYVEIVDPKGHPVPPGQEGEIIVTSLINYAMPLIRYRIGDYGIISTDPCPCGYFGISLAEVKGRVTDLFHGEDGSFVDGQYFIRLLYFKKWVRKCQFVQKKINRIEINIVSLFQPPKTDLEEIKQKMRILIGEKCQIEFNFVKNIRPHRSGKFRHTICEL